MNSKLPHYSFVRRAVKRFMPGTSVEAALVEAEALKQRDIKTVLTCLGENVSELSKAQEVKKHYLEVLEKVTKRGLDAQISLKLTHLGLDLDPGRTVEFLLEIASKAKELDNFVWIDMERSDYVNLTLKIFRRVRQQYNNVGLCLQAYLYRTRKDLDSLRPLAPHIRLVKGAYNEPTNVAYVKKRDVDRAYLELMELLLQDCKDNGALVAIASHDRKIVARARELARQMEIPAPAYEFEMLYGINREAQFQLAREGCSMRVLISYGEHWFPWYARRLAERPANVFFVLRSLFH